MAKITGPFLSLDASGTVFRTLTASRWKGINYMRGRIIPANPRTDDQTAVRLLIRHLSQGWATDDGLISAEYKTAYNTAAEGLPLSGFNLFIRDGVAKNGGKDYDGTVEYPTEPGDQTPNV